MFTQELRAAFDQEAEDTGTATLLLTNAVGGTKDVIDRGYEIDLISQCVYLIFTMAWCLQFWI